MKNRDKITTLQKGFIGLYNRMILQLCEKIWEIERVKKLEGNDLYDFAGPGTNKEKLLKQLEKELKERQENLKVVKEIIKKYGRK